VGYPDAFLEVRDSGTVVLSADSLDGCILWAGGINAPEAGSCTAEQASFTIGFLPDTQYLVNDNGPCKRENLRGMFEYFIEHRSQLNVQLVAHLGDLTQGESEELKDETNGEEWDADPADWERFMAGFRVLQDTAIPFAPCRGNHDARAYFVDKFPVSHYQNKPVFGGYKNQLYNAYYLFSAAGQDVLVLVLDYHRGDYPVSIVNWANGVLQQHRDRLAIIVTHDHKEIRNDIAKRNDNVAFVIMGHSARDVHWTQVSHGGKTQHIFVFDYQNYGDHDCESAVVRTFTFHPSEQLVKMRTYSVEEGTYFTNGDCYDNSGTSGYRCQEKNFPFEIGG